MFPAPDSRKYNDKIGVVFNKGTFSVIWFLDLAFLFELKCYSLSKLIMFLMTSDLIFSLLIGMTQVFGQAWQRLSW